VSTSDELTDLPNDDDLNEIEVEMEGLGKEKREVSDSDEMPSLTLRPRHLWLAGIFVVGVVLFFYLVLPRITGLQESWDKLRDGDPLWLVLAALFELLSFFGYITLFRAVCLRSGKDDFDGGSRIGWSESYQITMAGLAATRLFAAAGAGGVALTAWALRKSGLSRRVVAMRVVTFSVLLYGAFMISLLVLGMGLHFGVFPGNAPFAVTLLPALFAAFLLALATAMTFVPGDFERRFEHWAGEGKSRVRNIGHKLAKVPGALSTGVRTAVKMTLRKDFGILGAFAWWFFDIAVLWASFHAFGESPQVAVLATAYFVGMIANVVPLPGGVGGVEGGMIGALIAFGEPTGVAVVGVLTYRVFAFWLPTIPGIAAYVQLRKTVSRWQSVSGAGRETT